MTFKSEQRSRRLSTEKTGLLILLVVLLVAAYPTSRESQVQAPPTGDPVPEVQSPPSAERALRPAPPSWDVPLIMNESVERWIRVYTGPQRPALQRWLLREGRVRRLILDRLRARGLPEDLIYLALTESGYHPEALSHAGALGLWQFMAPTARGYGLYVNPWVDERLDPVRATEAAIRYMEDLHRRFGSWHLVAAAYNVGGGRVERILREESPDVALDPEEAYWLIREHLPEETRQHIPRWLALAFVVKHADYFGFETVRESGVPDHRLVFLPGGISLDEVARSGGFATREIRALNPALIRDVTPPGMLYPLRVPAKEARKVFASLHTLAPAAPAPVLADQ